MVVKHTTPYAIWLSFTPRICRICCVHRLNPGSIHANVALRRSCIVNICVFCGSKEGNDPRYMKAARDAGRTLAERGMRVVYGGGSVGLMGAVADAALDAGGDVVGVMPRSLFEKEISHRRLTELHVVASMHERKQMMSKLSEGFIALPGGVGTLEEIFEQWTWAQLGIHQKPCAFLNLFGYYAHMQTMIASMVTGGFVSEEHADMLIVESDIDAVLRSFAGYIPPTPKWRPPNER